MVLNFSCLFRGHNFKKAAIRHNGIYYVCSCCAKMVWRPMDCEAGGIFLTPNEIYKKEEEIRPKK